MAMHAIDRAKERYGLDLEVRDLRNIAERIRADKGVLIASHDDGSSVWLIKVSGVLVRLVMCKDLKLVLTFLPANSKVSRTRISQGGAKIVPPKEFYKGGKRMYKQPKAWRVRK